ncbi:MAG: hypothetical protein SGILL_003785 [Bacillariaceae sp.]
MASVSPEPDLLDEDDRPKLVVHGIFAKSLMPRRDEHPEKPTLKELAPDQVMVRKRLSGKRKLKTEIGIVTEQEDPRVRRQFHLDIEIHDDDREDEGDPFDYALQKEDRIYEERRCVGGQIMNHPIFSKYMPSSPEQVLKNDDVRFGENVVVSGLEQKSICIGDIFQASEGGLRLQVTSPRLPCANVDKRNGTGGCDFYFFASAKPLTLASPLFPSTGSPFGSKGLKKFCMDRGLAGWFVRILEEGHLEDGMELVRVEHPYPKHNLEDVSKALYGEADRTWQLMTWAQWARSKEELEELCANPAFGWYEWKAEAQWLLDRWGRPKIMTKAWRAAEEEKRRRSPIHILSTAVSSTVPTQQLEVVIQSLQRFPVRVQKAYTQFVAVLVVGLAWMGLRALGFP